MSSDRERQALSDIDDSIANIRRFIGARSFDEFLEEEVVYHAVVRMLEIVSEASRHLSDDLKARHSEIDWKAVKDAGNIYRHRYSAVTEVRIWDTATKHLSALENAVHMDMARYTPNV